MLDIKLIRNDPEHVREPSGAEHAESALDKLLETTAPGGKCSWRCGEAFPAQRGERADRPDQAGQGGCRRADRGHAEGRRRDQGVRRPAQGDRSRSGRGVPPGAQSARAFGARGRRRHSEVMLPPGEPRKFNFPPLDHLDLAAKYDLIDMERGARTSAVASPISRAIWCSCSSPWCSSPCRSWPPRASGLQSCRCWSATRLCTAQASSAPTCSSSIA